MRKRYYFVLALIIAAIICTFPELSRTNEGTSRARGTVSSGSLENAWLLPYSGSNFRYFSPLSYFVLDRGYVHSRMYQTILTAYENCAATCPGRTFRVMECAREHGGNLWPHRTHQLGLSADFMLPKKRNGAANYWLDRLGIWHYLLAADTKGRYFAGVEIDFETLGRHLLALDDAARQNGLRIKKVILQINLKDEFYATPSGKEVRRRGIYLAKKLPTLVDELHDDHYHVDFSLN